jgi:hypothetical protein
MSEEFLSGSGQDSILSIDESVLTGRQCFCALSIYLRLFATSCGVSRNLVVRTHILAAALLAEPAQVSGSCSPSMLTPWIVHDRVGVSPHSLLA